MKSRFAEISFDEFFSFPGSVVSRNPKGKLMASAEKSIEKKEKEEFFLFFFRKLHFFRLKFFFAGV